MSELEERLNSLFSNPQLMQQIAAMAQTLVSQSQEAPPPQQEPPNTGLNPQLIQAMMQTLGQSGIDKDQQTLLHALSPYLSPYRVQKLERAMQAARLAGAASAFFRAGGLQILTGR